MKWRYKAGGKWIMDKEAEEYFGQLRRGYEVNIVTAERRGWDQAIAALRDGERFSKWDSAQTLRPRGPVTRRYHADYLTAVRDAPAERGTEHG